MNCVLVTKSVLLYCVSHQDETTHCQKYLDHRSSWKSRSIQVSILAARTSSDTDKGVAEKVRGCVVERGVNCGVDSA